jgi:F-type H+-transporting ATPase subunit gamma
MQITSAMKMVSAAKLKRAQNAITQMRPYANKLTELLINLSSSLESSEQGGYSVKRKLKNVLIIPVTSNRGLCGGFNANVIKASTSLCENDYKDCKTSFISIGKKSSDFFRKNNYNVISSHDEVFTNLNYDSISKIALNVMDRFVDEEFDKVIIVYNQFKNAATQYVMTENFLPVENNEKTEEAIGDYIFEPEKEEIVLELIPKSLKTQLFKAVLDSHASEHGARMTAMHKATDNAGDLKKDLTLTYNKARQAAITAEILEIVGGAEALSG